MAISNDIITNRLDKKINYGVTRTDYDSFKSVVNESIPSPIPNPSHDLWMESHLIPDGVTGWNNPTSPYTAHDAPAVNTEQVEIWMYNPTASQGDRVGFGAQATGIGDVKGVYELTLDPSVGSKRTWLVSSEPGNPYAPLITNFIRTTYGAKYAPRFVVGPKSYTVNSDGSVNVGAGSGLGSGNHNLPGSLYKTMNPVRGGQEFYFDMEAGTVTFAGDVMPTNVDNSDYSVYIKKAYRYCGRIGLSNADWNSYIDYSQLTIPTVDTAEVNNSSGTNFSMTSVHEFQFDTTSGFELSDETVGNRNIVKVSMPSMTSSSVTLPDQSSDPTATLTEKKIFAKSVGGGGTGVYVADGATTNEFVSKSKSIIYGLIF